MGAIILEKDILKSCINRLDWWERIGVVIHYDRYNSGNIHMGRTHLRMARNGTPDLTAYINYKGICAIAFFECKRPGCKQSEDQLKFMMKFKDLTNVYYDVITHPSQLNARIESITNYYENQIKGMTL